MYFKNFKIVVVASFFLMACNQKKDQNKAIVSNKYITNKNMAHSSGNHVSDPQIEKFSSFFKLFMRDTIFQRSRVKFPLKNYLKSLDGDSIKTLNSKDWTSTNFTRIKNLVTKEQIINKTHVAVLFLIEDTGVHVTYSFEVNNSLWNLSSITDESD